MLWYGLDTRPCFETGVQGSLLVLPGHRTATAARGRQRQPHLDSQLEPPSFIAEPLLPLFAPRSYSTWDT